MSEQISGTVKWYNPEKAYGFITTETGEDVFVHRRSIAGGRTDLVDGQSVVFQLRAGPKGTEAYDVYVTQDVEIPPHRQRAYASAAATGAGGYDRADSFSARRPREAYSGPLPEGPVEARVKSIDPNGRFMFVRTEEGEIDAFVHRSLAPRYGAPLQVGDRVRVVLEPSDRGPRASWLEPA